MDKQYQSLEWLVDANLVLVKKEGTWYKDGHQAIMVLSRAPDEDANLVVKLFQDHCECTVPSEDVLGRELHIPGS